MKIRFFEDAVVKVAYGKEIQTPVHLYTGQEAIAAGVCLNLDKDDYVFSTHRSHGHYLAQGGDMNMLMAEIFCRETGCSSGYGGSMHVTDPDVGFMGSSAIVAGTVPIAVGAGLSAKMDKGRRVSVAFFGDGATDEGVFFESVNLAALYEIPVIFICENNLFSTHLPIFKRQKKTELFQKARSFGINAKRIDGNNPFEVYSAAGKMIRMARDGNGPSFLECMTYRWLAHVGPTPDIDIGYRRKEDIEHWQGRCPIRFLTDYLIREKCATEETLEILEKEVREEVDQALAFARNSNVPCQDHLKSKLFEVE